MHGNEGYGNDQDRLAGGTHEKRHVDAGVDPANCQTPQPNILIVDDDPAVRVVAEEMLRTLGCEVAAAGSGKDGLQLLDQRAFDLVMLDVGMPYMSGIEVYHILREALPAQKVAFLTGYASEDIDELNDANVWLIAKPFTMESLTQALNFATG